MNYLPNDECKIIGRKYKLLNKIGSGSFGVVYKGENTRTKEKVAIKIEPLKGKCRLLKHEAQISRHLQSNHGISSIKWYGIDEENAYAVFDLLGISLETYFERLKKFSLKTVLLLGIQILNRLKMLHSNGIIHRDIKPDNFMMGSKDSETVYIIDFGLSKNFIENGEHIQFKDKKKITGTVRYASINIHNGMEPSRRDDLISLGYMLIFFYKGTLPWQGLSAKSKEEKYEKISNIKKTISIKELCKGLPYQFENYFKYCYNLKFSEKPNYRYLEDIFINIIISKNIESNQIYFDWDITNSKDLIEVNLDC